MSVRTLSIEIWCHFCLVMIISHCNGPIKITVLIGNCVPSIGYTAKWDTITSSERYQSSTSSICSSPLIHLGLLRSLRHWWWSWDQSKEVVYQGFLGPLLTAGPTWRFWRLEPSYCYDWLPYAINLENQSGSQW